MEHSMIRTSRATLGLIATLAAGTPSAAQIIRGSVATAGDHRPLASAVVQLLDSAGNDVARTLTHADGSFLLRAPLKDRFRVTARVVGYHPATTPFFLLTHDTTVALELGRLPNTLPALTTTARTDCDVTADTASAVWSLWDQASTAMLSAITSFGDREKEFRFVISSRVYWLRPTEFASVSFAETVLRGTRPWQSWPADSLALRGYVVPDDSGKAYYAPDLDVLLSRSFVNTHCVQFHSQHVADSRLVGIDFVPSPSIKHADVTGTFWIDKSSRELRSLEFRYVNIPVLADTLIGGRMQFMRLESGEWLLPQWAIRAPIEAQVAFDGDLRDGLGSRRERPDLLVPRPTVIKVKRGDLIAATSIEDDGPHELWSAPTGAVHLRVTSRDGLAEPGATVRLPSSTLEDTTDSPGTVTFTGLADGDYAADLTNEAYGDLHRPPEHIVFTIAHAGVVSRTVRVASPAELVRSICGPNPPHRDLMIIRMVTRGGVPEAGATRYAFRLRRFAGGLRLAVM
jgi:hypothetical protein